ncbi:MAG: DUF3164 family protein [Desulfovibrio sp.]
MDAIPEGFMQNGQGSLIPIERVKPIDLERDKLVQEKVAKVFSMQEELKRLKSDVMGDIEAFVSLSAEEYGVTIGGKKGNVTLTSYDGKYKLVRSINDHLAFDERIQAAKELIDECLKEWTVGSRTEIQALINDAFQVDKEGKINTGRILGLRRLDISDPKWKQAMEAISDSVHSVGSKAYFRAYKRNEQGDYKQISLDMASV